MLTNNTSAKSRKMPSPRLPLLRTDLEKMELFASEWAYFQNSKKIMIISKNVFFLKNRGRCKCLLYSIKTMQTVGGLQFLHSLVELYKSFE